MIKPGLYFARPPKYQWWSVILEVTGDAPFMRYRAVNRDNNLIKTGSDPREEYVIGPPIDEPPV